MKLLTFYHFVGIRGAKTLSCSYSGNCKIVNNYRFSTCFLGEDKIIRDIVLRTDKYKLEEIRTEEYFLQKYLVLEIFHHLYNILYYED